MALAHPVLPVGVTVFTDPACPFAFSAEPVRLRLEWHYGEQLAWRTRMIVLTREPGEAEKLAQGAPTLQRRHGMPIDPAPHPRPASSEPACRAVVAAREHVPGTERALLRRIRVLVMAGGLIDDPAVLARAAAEAGLDAGELAEWSASEVTARALEEDAAAARAPAPAARALDHRLGGPADARRYTAPSYELRRSGGDDAAPAVVPGFNPYEAYEVALANLAPELVSRPAPGSVAEVLDWAREPLATAEVAAVAGLELTEARAALTRVGTPAAAGADLYWTLAETGRAGG
jgi:predicted DsbA family dithiol-disulfide isomerase